MRNKDVEIGQAVVPLKSMDKASCRVYERGEVGMSNDSRLSELRSRLEDEDYLNTAIDSIADDVVSGRKVLEIQEKQSRPASVLERDRAIVISLQGEGLSQEKIAKKNGWSRRYVCSLLQK